MRIFKLAYINNILSFIILTKESIEYDWNILVYNDTPSLLIIDSSICDRLMVFDAPIKMYLFILDILFVYDYYSWVYPITCL